MAVLDLQPDCHLLCLHFHLYNISCNRMVCIESKLKLSRISSSYSMSTFLLREKTANCASFHPQTVPNYQRIVVFRLGRVCPPKGPGIVLVLPLIDQWQRVDLRTRAFNIPPCQVTRYILLIISSVVNNCGQA